MLLFLYCHGQRHAINYNVLQRQRTANVPQRSKRAQLLRPGNVHQRGDVEHFDLFQNGLQHLQQAIGELSLNNGSQEINIKYGALGDAERPCLEVVLGKRTAGCLRMLPTTGPCKI